MEAESSERRVPPAAAAGGGSNPGSSNSCPISYSPKFMRRDGDVTVCTMDKTEYSRIVGRCSTSSVQHYLPTSPLQSHFLWNIIDVDPFALE